MSIRLRIVTIIGAICLASSASAATCSVNNVSFTLSGASGAQCVVGNDLGRNGIEAKNLEFFDMAGWSVGDSTESSVGDGVASFLSAPAVRATSGSWSLASFGGYGPLMIVLKSGRKFGAFLLQDAMSSLSGTWSIERDRCTANGCTKIGKVLSHASVYYGDQPAPVPLPAAGLMLLGALAGLSALRRSGKAA